MTKIPNISVIIPAYNEERHIGRAIRSLLAQSLPDDEYEILVVNDASEDRTAYAMGLFADQILQHHNEKNMGLPASLNVAIKQARGKFVVRVDADDYVRSDYLYVLSQFLEDNMEWDAVACDYLLIDENEKVLDRVNCIEQPIGCGIMFRTDLLISIGLYDETFLMHEDQELRKRFLEKYEIHRVALPLYRYRKHEGNMTNNKSVYDRYETKLQEKFGR
ncbi:MAG: glycosyltransferase family 2 protein [Alphaproteobacteria bacterium]|nr:glycosyltransferase family 2 protein [Alphaproteobacteria bacterium]